MALPTVVLDIGFSGPETGSYYTIGDSVRGEVNDLPIGPSSIWSTVPSSKIKNWSVRYGASKGDDPTLRYEAATLSVVLHDPDREFDPENLDGPHVLAGRSLVEAMVRVRLRAVWDGVSYPLFWGYADDFEVDYQGNDWTYVNLTATDPTKIMAAIDREAAVAPVGAGENSGARIERILDGIGWPSVQRFITAGNASLQETDLNGNVQTELQLVQDSEQGEFYFDRQGRAFFRNRSGMLNDFRSKTSQTTYGDGGYAATGEIPFADAKPSKADDGVVNRITAAIEGGTAQTVENASSVARYLPHTHQRMDLIMQTDADALSWAKSLLYQFGVPRYRFARLEFNTPQPEVEDVFWPSHLLRQLGDRITVKRRPKGGGDPIVKDCFVRGVEYSSDGVAWTSSFILQSAERYSFFVIDDPNYGRIGYNAIAY